MKPLQNALKSSFIHHTSLKFNHHQQPLFDDLPTPTTLTTTDDFFVDDLLDFSTMSNCDGEATEYTNVYEETQMVTETTEQEILNGVVEEKAMSEICVPADDVADLEWLSQFVEDSFTEYSLTCALPSKTTTDDALQVEATGKVGSRARSKRARNGAFNRSVSASETMSSTSSSSSTTSFTSASTWLIYNNASSNHNDAVFDSTNSSLALPLKTKKFKPSSVSNKSAQPRRCSHCGVQKTPQWRAGPQGAKTLCNACGVRFKSGRLLPEYRPACSPTFSSELHSNSHRRVLEMRNKKEVELPGSGRNPVVSSF